MIVFKVDEFTPCLKDAETGEIFETEVVRIRRKSFLSKFNKKPAGMSIGVNSPKEQKFMHWFSKVQ